MKWFVNHFPINLSKSFVVEAAVKEIPSNQTFGEFMNFSRAAYLQGSLPEEHVSWLWGTWNPLESQVETEKNEKKTQPHMCWQFLYLTAVIYE